MWLTFVSECSNCVFYKIISIRYLETHTSYHYNKSETTKTLDISGAVDWMCKRLGKQKEAVMFSENENYNLNTRIYYGPIPVTARSKARVCGCSLAGISGSNPAGGMDSWLLWILCCQVEVSETGRSLVQRSPTARLRARARACVYEYVYVCVYVIECGYLQWVGRKR